MNPTPTHYEIAIRVREQLARYPKVPQSIDGLALACQLLPAVVRGALHTLTASDQAHLVRPGGDFAYLPGPLPPENERSPDSGTR